MPFRVTVKSYRAWLCVVVTILCGFNVYASCPGVCFCPPLSQNVYCSRQSLPFIPSGIPTNTVQLNLNDNNFQNSRLMRSNFSRFSILEQLYLSGCGVEFLSVGTFVDLFKLKWLDLSKNRLKTIGDDTFRGLTLEHIFLNDNPGVQIATGAFRGLSTIGLYIHNCAIVNISLEVLRPLNGTLKSLWLDGNKFERFSYDWFYLFNTLSHIRLGDNPLHCNCEAAWVYKFYERNPTAFSEGNRPASRTTPACRTPSRLRGKTFVGLTADDFRCQLPVFKNVDIIFEQTIGKLTCLASGDPTPRLYWIKPDGSAETFQSKSDVTVKDTEGVMYISDPQLLDKAKYACVASNPAGNVTFTLNVAWPPMPSQSIAQEDSALLVDPVKEKAEKEKADKNKEINDKPYDYGSSQSGINMLESTSRGSETHFAMVDIIGAVVGTFLLTLLACVVVFHFFYRHHEKLYYRNKKHKEERTKCYVVSEEENTLKMLEHNGGPG